MTKGYSGGQEPIGGSSSDESVQAVFAQFGLCFFLLNVLETNMVNVLVTLQVAERNRRSDIFSNQRELMAQSEAYHDHLRAQTYGNNLKQLEKSQFAPADIIHDLRKLKHERDNLAHRFFYDHSMQFMTDPGCSLMLERLKRIKEEIMRLDTELDEIQINAAGQLGFNRADFEKYVAQVTEEHDLEARSLFPHR